MLSYFHFLLLLLLLLFSIIVPGSVGYSYNKVAVAVKYFKYQFCLIRCDLILFTLNKPAPEQVYVYGPVAMTATPG